MVFNIVIFLFVLGLLVFFHELGHFLAAKACGVYVDRFSLGMPPRLFGVKLGETDYCIGALPFGGYVKMAGQEDTPLSDEEREQTYGHVPEHRKFDKKPLWQRFIVILAGPMMNLVLAVILYAIVAAVGAEVPETEVDNRIGAVLPNSPAATAPMYLMPGSGEPVDLNRPPDATGWETGDRVETINGAKITNIMDVAIDAVLGGGKIADVVVQRTEPDGTVKTYLSPVEPKQVSSDEKHPRFGVAPFETALVDQVLDKSPAKEAGLQKGDIIERANGKIIDRSTFVEMVEKAPPSEPIQLLVKRKDPSGNTSEINVNVRPETIGRLLDVQFGPEHSKAPNPEQQPPVVAASSDELRKDKKLLPGDLVLNVNGKPATLGMLQDIERTEPNTTLDLEIKRPAVLFGLLRSEKDERVQVPIASVRAIGVQMGTVMVFSRVPAGQVLPEAFRQGCRDIDRTVRTLTSLIMRTVSVKDLGGPVMIYQVTTMAARTGYYNLFKITAFISANLCVFNLLPLPVLDGGLLLYLLIEGIRRKPLDIKVLERIQQVGLVLIIFLLLFVTFNDISRWVSMRLE